MIGPGGGKCFLMPWGSCFEVRWCQLQVEENEIIFHISFDISHLSFEFVLAAWRFKLTLDTIRDLAFATTASGLVQMTNEKC